MNRQLCLSVRKRQAQTGPSALIAGGERDWRVAVERHRHVHDASLGAGPAGTTGACIRDIRVSHTAVAAAARQRRAYLTVRVTLAAFGCL